MEKQTTGTVVAVSRQRWLKVNQKPFRLHALDGASFPHIVKIRYTVDGRSYVCRAWAGAGIRPPGVGEAAAVFYREDRPSRARAAL